MKYFSNHLAENDSSSKKTDSQQATQLEMKKKEQERALFKNDESDDGEIGRPVL